MIMVLALAASIHAGAQSQSEEYLAAKRALHRGLTVKEWNTDARNKTRWMDHQTTYDAEGRKVEEIEYTQYGQKWRETYEYGENDRIVKEVVYNEKDKPSLIRKYEYNADGRKLRQYNYTPDGRLQTTKVFEYTIAQ